MPTVILARHGRTSANAAGVLAGRTRGVHLDDAGRGQAQRAAERIEGVPLALVVSSPMQRCRETAKLLAPGHRVVGERRLTECDYGEWTGRPLKELVKEPMWRVVQRQPSAAVFPGGESLPAMAARAVGAVRDLDATVAREHGADAVWLVVSHGDVLKAILADALGVHLDAFQRIVVDPASLSVVRYAEDRPFVLATNSTGGSLAHLGPHKGAGRTRHGGHAKPVGGSDAAVGGGAGPAPGPDSDPGRVTA